MVALIDLPECRAMARSQDVPHFANICLADLPPYFYILILCQRLERNVNLDLSVSVTKSGSLRQIHLPLLNSARHSVSFQVCPHKIFSCGSCENILSTD